MTSTRLATVLSHSSYTSLCDKRWRYWKFSQLELKERVLLFDL